MSDSKKLRDALDSHFEDTQIPEEVDLQVRQSFMEYHMKKGQTKMKKRILVFSLAAAILIPTGAFALNSSYFANSHVTLNGLIDSGVKQAASQGLTVPMDQKITDQGITIHFSEVYVEDTKVLIHYRIEKQDGTLVPFEFDTTGLELRTDGKVNGEQVENPTYNVAGQSGFNQLSFIGTEEKSNLPFTLVDETGKELETGIADHDKPEGVIAFVTSGAKLPQTIKLNVNANRIGTVKGKWKGQFTIDQSKATQATKTTK